MTNRSKKITSIFVGVVFGLLVAEAGLRLYNLFQHKDVNLDHKKVPLSLYRDNQKYSIEKPAGCIRIAFIGDSLTFGQGVARGDTFAYKTGRMLQREFPGAWVEAINFGHPGFNVTQNLLRLKNEVLRFNPDIVVYGYCINDFTNRFTTHKFMAKMKEGKRRFSFLRPLEHFSRLAYYVDWISVHLFSHIKPLHDEWLNNSLDPQKNRAFPDMEQDLKELISLLAQRNGVLIIFPIFNSNDEDSTPYYRKARFLAVHDCERMSCSYIELFPYLKSRSIRQWWVNADDHHPNPRGHELVARLLVDELKKKPPFQAVTPR